MAFFAPRSASRSAMMSSSRHWQRIWMATSPGMRFSSMRRRQKSNSICEADGKADLDFLEADFHEQLEILEFLLDAHGLGEGLVAVAEIDAAPERRAGSRVRLGHWRLGRATGGNGRYLVMGAGCMERSFEKRVERRGPDKTS
jgi:hypothetical protein